MSILNLKLSSPAKGVMRLFSAALVALAVVCPSTASAQTQTTGKALRVHLKSGTYHCYLLASEPVINFEDTKCKVSSPELTTEYSMSEINYAHFGEYDAASITDIESTLTIDLSDPDRVVINGMKADGSVVLYNITGVELRRTNADGTGAASLGLTGLEKGIYIIQTKETSFKIYRK